MLLLRLYGATRNQGMIWHSSVFIMWCHVMLCYVMSYLSFILMCNTVTTIASAINLLCSQVLPSDSFKYKELNENNWTSNRTKSEQICITPYTSTSPLPSRKSIPPNQNSFSFQWTHINFSFLIFRLLLQKYFHSMLRT